MEDDEAQRWQTARCSSLLALRVGRRANCCVRNGRRNRMGKRSRRLQKKKKRSQARQGERVLSFFVSTPRSASAMHLSDPRCSHRAFVLGEGPFLLGLSCSAVGSSRRLTWMVLVGGQPCLGNGLQERATPGRGRPAHRGGAASSLALPFDERLVSIAFTKGPTGRGAIQAIHDGG